MIFINESYNSEQKQKRAEWNFLAKGKVRLGCLILGALLLITGVALLIFIDGNMVGAYIAALGAAMAVVGAVAGRQVERAARQKAAFRAVFEENVFEIASSQKGKYGGRFGYGELSVTEYPEVWVLDLEDGSWFTLNKSDMTEGTAEGLSEFLKERLKEKYAVEEESAP